jgi:hypothetical protein
MSKKGEIRKHNFVFHKNNCAVNGGRWLVCAAIAAAQDEATAAVALKDRHVNDGRRRWRNHGHFSPKSS